MRVQNHPVGFGFGLVSNTWWTATLKDWASEGEQGID